MQHFTSEELMFVGHLRKQVRLKQGLKFFESGNWAQCTL